MWIFENPKSYPDMCKKIAQSVFIISLIELFILAQISNDFSEFLKKISFNTETQICGIKMYVSYIYIPLVLSILENIFKMHDKIGRIFKIRPRNAATVIFPAYMKELGISTSKSNKDQKGLYYANIDLQRVMGDHFYYHVSYSHPKIDNHEVYMALDSWTWFWIILDTFCVTMLFIIALIVVSIFFFRVSMKLYVGLTIYLLLLLLLDFFLLKHRCSYYTKREIHLAIKYDKENNNGKLNEKLKGQIENALYNK